MKRAGFTVLEISLVMLILAFLLAAVNLGSAVLFQGKLRAVIKEYTFYDEAISNFTAVYGQLPGDFSNATAFWSSSGNGNGDGLIAQSQTVAGNGTEWQRAWDHLSRAGMIPYSITYSTTIGCPYYSISGIGGVTSYYTDPPEVVNSLGCMVVANLSIWSNPSNINWIFVTMPPKQTYPIDVKMDDGIPSTGYWQTTSNASGACTNVSGSAYITDDALNAAGGNNANCFLYLMLTPN